MSKQSKQGSNNVLITTKLYQGSNHPTDLISINESHGGNTRTTYFDYDYSAGNGVYTITVTDPAGNETSKTTDGLGNLISATDDGGAISYEYNNRNQIKEIRVNGDVAATMTYDNYGFQNSLNDRDAGLIVYEYNNFNQLKTQTDARQSVTTIDYNDPLGRITSKTVNSGSSNYVYSYAYVQTGNNGVNQLQNVSVTGPSGTFSEINTYDYLGRILSFEQVSDGQALTTNCSYDVSNNIETTTFPGGFKIKNEYTNKGFLKKILNLENNFLIWETVETNDFGQIREYKQGFQPMTSIIEYDHFGYAKRFFTPGVQDLNMEFNLQSGNLNWREDLSNGRNLKEEFTYGVLDRLESSTVTSPVVLPHVSVSYNTTNGSIVSKSDAGSFSDYSVAHKNAVENIYGFTSNIPVQQQDLTYTPFNKVKTIEEGDNALVLKYGQDDQRKVVDFYNQGNLIHKRYYHPNYEKEIDGNLTREINYIQGPNGICAMHIVENGVANTHYVFKDHLGSVLKLTDEYGSVIAEQNFDAWGRKRNPADWTYSSVTSSPLLYRGFTGHEHLPQFNLINMNGRMYDPVLGLMLSPDNFVQEHRTLNYNRYSYCVNNPLKYVDKDGNYFIIDDIAAMAIGGGMNLYNAFQAGKVHSFWEGAAYFSAGAIGAEVGLYAGPAAGFAVGGLLTVGADFGFGNVATDNKGNI